MLFGRQMQPVHRLLEHICLRRPAVVTLSCDVVQLYHNLVSATAVIVIVQFSEVMVKLLSRLYIDLTSSLFL